MTVNLSADSLVSIMPLIPRERAELWLPYLRSALAEFRIDTPRRAAAFLAQAAHESTELSHLVENLNYGAEGLLKTWPTRFDGALAAKLARKPMAIAEHVYGGRLGNAGEGRGEGWLYRGRGCFQLTGKDNYKAAGAALGLSLLTDPDIVAHPDGASRTAGWFWNLHRLSDLADANDFIGVTRRINPALNGLESRRIYWGRAKFALGIGG